VVGEKTIGAYCRILWEDPKGGNPRGLLRQKILKGFLGVLRNINCPEERVTKRGRI